MDAANATQAVDVSNKVDDDEKSFEERYGVSSAEASKAINNFLRDVHRLLNPEKAKEEEEKGLREMAKEIFRLDEQVRRTHIFETIEKKESYDRMIALVRKVMSLIEERGKVNDDDRLKGIELEMIELNGELSSIIQDENDEAEAMKSLKEYKDRKLTKE